MLTLLLKQKKAEIPSLSFRRRRRQNDLAMFREKFCPTVFKNDTNTKCWLALLGAVRQTSYIMCHSDFSERKKLLHCAHHTGDCTPVCSFDTSYCRCILVGT